MTTVSEKGHFSVGEQSFTKSDFLAENLDYPDWKPFQEGLLDVGDGHEIFYQVAGNPNGIPVVALHGGPGEGSKLAYVEHFDPNIHKIVILDQRGCGLSKPYASTDNNGFKDNIGDLHKLKDHLNISEPWSVYGISAGTTFAQKYAVQHPQDIDTLILDATCFGDQPSAEWLVDPSEDWLCKGTDEQRSMKNKAYGEYIDFVRNADFIDDPAIQKEILELHISQAYYRCLSGEFGDDVAVAAATQFMIYNMRLLSPEITDDMIEDARKAAEDNLALSKLFYHFYIGAVLDN